MNSLYRRRIPNLQFSQSNQNVASEIIVNNRVASFSGFGGDCCPLVMDPLTIFALLGFLAAATYMLRVEITMSMLMAAGRRRKRDVRNSYQNILDVLHSGKPDISFRFLKFSKGGN